MFLFPNSEFNTQAIQLDQSNQNHSQDKTQPALHNFSMLFQKEGEDHLRSLNVPFCINVMSGGRYSTQRMVALTSLSDKEHFYLEKKQDINQAEASANEEIQMHHHDYYELMYVLDGSVEQHIENGCFQYIKGDASLLNCNTRHYEVLGESYFLVFLCLSKHFIRELLSETKITESMSTDIYRFYEENIDEPSQYKKNYLEFKPTSSRKEAARTIEGLMESLTRELLLKQSGHFFIVKGLVMRILTCFQDPALYRCRPVVLDSSAEAYLFHKITGFMEQKEGRVTRSELSKHLNYSSDYINRVIKKHSGMSLSEYNQIICIKKAEHLLVETRQSITSIITALGFENKTHFYRLFDRKHGITPMEYRKKHQN